MSIRTAFLITSAALVVGGGGALGLFAAAAERPQRLVASTESAFGIRPPEDAAAQSLRQYHSVLETFAASFVTQGTRNKTRSIRLAYFSSQETIP
jgi:hypothetical protein